MPPIRVEMRFAERTAVMPDIAAGGYGSFSDASPEAAKVLVITCNPEDNGGIVYSQPIGDTAEILGGKARVHFDAVDNIEAVVGNDSSVELEVHTKFGKGILSLTHVSPSN